MSLRLPTLRRREPRGWRENDAAALAVADLTSLCHNPEAVRRAIIRAYRAYGGPEGVTAELSRRLAGRPARPDVPPARSSGPDLSPSLSAMAATVMACSGRWSVTTCVSSTCRRDARRDHMGWVNMWFSGLGSGIVGGVVAYVVARVQVKAERRSRLEDRRIETVSEYTGALTRFSLAVAQRDGEHAPEALFDLMRCTGQLVARYQRKHGYFTSWVSFACQMIIDLLIERGSVGRLSDAERDEVVARVAVLQGAAERWAECPGEREWRKWESRSSNASRLTQPLVSPRSQSGHESR